MVGGLLIGIFLGIVFAYICTEYLMLRFEARRRVLDGTGHPLLILLTANLTSFLLLWLSAMAFVAASDTDLYYHMTLVCIVVQAVWLTQHLWFYYRDHLRLRFE